MKKLEGYLARIEGNRDIWFDLIRIYVGLGLFIKAFNSAQIPRTCPTRSTCSAPITL
jgi:hypothetical protein